MSILLSVGRRVCHNFLEGREVTRQYSFASTLFIYLLMSAPIAPRNCLSFQAQHYSFIKKIVPNKKYKLIIQQVMECQIQRRRRHLRPPPLCPPTATTCPPGVGGAPSSTGAPPPALPCPTGMYVGTCAGTVASNPNALKGTL